MISSSKSYSVTMVGVGTIVFSELHPCAIVWAEGCETVTAELASNAVGE